MNFGVNDGHTIKGFGTGAVGIINESVQTRIVGAEVRRLLKIAGHNAINCTVDSANSVSQSLSLIMDQANRLDLDWFVSLHFNAGGGQGVEAYTYGGRQYRDAIDVCSNITKLGFKNRGVKDGKGLYVIRRTKAKSILIEVCFVDTSDANLYFKIGYKTIAKAIVEGLLGHAITTSNITTKAVNVPPTIIFRKILKMTKVTDCIDSTGAIAKTFKTGDKITAVNEYGGYWLTLIGRVPKTSTEDIVEVPIVDDTVYRVVTGSFADKENADKRVEELKKAGVDSFITTK